MTSKPLDKQSQVKVIETNEEINNKFFFKDIEVKKLYTYKGTIWGNTVVEGEKPENTNDEGEVYVIAKLNISQIARFSKGKLYEFNFTIYGERNSTEEKGQKEYYWVTEDKIYSFSPPKDFDAKNFVKNGILDCLSCAKALEVNGLLPSDDESLLICSNSSIKFHNDNKLVTEEIVVKNDISKYSYEHSSGHYQIREWKIGKGLTHYAWGYGAKREGMKLELVE